MPKITKVTVSASTAFNHPYEAYANFKPFVSLEAELEDGDDYYRVVKDLQDRAETLVQSHKDEILEDLERIQKIQETRNSLEYARQRQKNNLDNTAEVGRLEKQLADLLDQQSIQHMITQSSIIDEVSADEFEEEFKGEPDDDELEEMTNMATSESPEPLEDIAF